MDYNQFRIDIPRMVVYINKSLYNGSSDQLINIIREKYPQNKDYVYGMCVQQYLARYFKLLTKMFREKNRHVVDGGKEYLYLGDKNVTIIKPFHIIDSNTYKIKSFLLLKITYNTKTNKTKSVCEKLDTNISMNIDSEWDIINDDISIPSETTMSKYFAIFAAMCILMV